MIPAGRPAGTTKYIESTAVSQLLAKGWSKERLARELGCSVRTVYNCAANDVLPTDEAQLSKLKALAKAKGVKIP